MVYIIGLNSGSSFDGLDVVLCQIGLAEDGHPSKPTYIDGLTVSWPDQLQDAVMKAFRNELTIFEMTRLNYAAGALYAEATNQLIKKAGLTSEDVDVVGYDGQTIYQEPPDRAKEKEYILSGNASLVDRWLGGGMPCGFFIAESGVVAALTDIDTVTQFRPVDHALGGSAAPLMQYLDFVAFRDDAGSTVTLNIGGIANLQLANKNRSKMMAFDTGPGNVMIDHVARVRTGQRWDDNGKLAGRGTVIQPLLAQLHKHEFFSRNPPRSAWRLDFGAEFADNILSQYAEASTEDLLATLTLFTAQSIAKSLKDFILPRGPVSQFIASGGGTRNGTLMKNLGDELSKVGLKVTISDEVGLPAAYKEAIKFATLAFANKRSLANNIPAAGGAVKYAVLGKLTLAPSKARNAEPVVGRNEKVLGLKDG